MTHVFLHYQYLDYGYSIFHYYRCDKFSKKEKWSLKKIFSRLPVEERSFNTTFNPMCEVFPKVATCDYIRFGRLGGGQSNKNAICILSLNIINDKVFAILWFWHLFLLIAGTMRIFTRTFQLSSSTIRYFLMKIQMHRYLSNNRHAKHIQHYVINCR